jgi:transcription elongation factor GreA-like protein
MIEVEINNTRLFLSAQLELHKIEFAEKDDNRHLEAMNSFNKAIIILDKLFKVSNGTYKELKETRKELMKTKQQLEESLRLSNINNDSRYFTIKGVKYELTGNVTTPGGKLMHHIKNTVTNDYKRDDNGDVIPVSDVDLKKILASIK